VIGGERGYRGRRAGGELQISDGMGRGLLGPDGEKGQCVRRQKGEVMGS